MPVLWLIVDDTVEKISDKTEYSTISQFAHVTSTMPYLNSNYAKQNFRAEQQSYAVASAKTVTG